MIQNNKKQQGGLTLFEVVLYLALTGVFLSVVLPTSLNIIAITQAQQSRLQSDQQFVTLMHSIEGLVRNNQVNLVADIDRLLDQYETVVSSSSVAVTVDNQTGVHTLVLSCVYNQQIYNYVYTY